MFLSKARTLARRADVWAKMRLLRTYCTELRYALCPARFGWIGPSFLLQAKQPNVEELLAQADELISTQQPKQEVYGAMADSLGQAWRDLNDLLEYRRLLLERAVAFHRQVAEVRIYAAVLSGSMNIFIPEYSASKKSLTRKRIWKKTWTPT